MKKIIITFMLLLSIINLFADDSQIEAVTESGKKVILSSSGTWEYIISISDIEGRGFDTPEDAAKAYLIFLKNQDLSGMISTFAIESYVKNFDLKSFISRVSQYRASFSTPLPNTNEYTRELNIALRRGNIVRNIFYQYMSYQTPDQLDWGRSNSSFNSDISLIETFINKFERDTGDYIFDDLMITGLKKPENLARYFLSEGNQQNIARAAVFVGVNNIEDVANVAVTFDAHGQAWLFCPQTVRYNNKWYLQELCGNLGILLGIDSLLSGIIPVDNL